VLQATQTEHTQTNNPKITSTRQNKTSQSASFREAPRLGQGRKMVIKSMAEPAEWQTRHHNVDYMRLLVDSCTAMMVSMVDVQVMQYDNHSQYQYHTQSMMITYRSFVQSVFFRGRMTYSVVLIGLLYLARFRYALLKSLHRPSFYLEQERRRSDFIPRLFMTSLLLSTKFLCDRHDTNGMWARTHHQSLQAVNHSESLFLTVVNYNLGVSERAFSTWMRQIFTPNHLRMYMNQTVNVVTLPPSPPYYLSDSEQRLAEKRRRLERAI
jgi:hypothetical protein